MIAQLWHLLAEPAFHSSFLSVTINSSDTPDCHDDDTGDRGGDGEDGLIEAGHAGQVLRSASRVQREERECDSVTGVCPGDGDDTTDKRMA